MFTVVMASVTSNRSLLKPYFLISLLALVQIICSVDIYKQVAWQSSRTLNHYSAYSSTQLLHFLIPEDCVLVTWNFQSSSNKPDCSLATAYVYFQKGSFPLYKENNNTFPENFYLNPSSTFNFAIKNLSSYAIMSPELGNWFAIGFLSNTSNKIRQKGLTKSCQHSLQIMTEFHILQDVPTVIFNEIKETLLHESDQNRAVYRFKVPQMTHQYRFTVISCNVTGDLSLNNCPMFAVIGNNKVPNYGMSLLRADCWKNRTSCYIDVESPVLEGWSYLSLYLQTAYQNTSWVNIKWHLEEKECTFIPPTQMNMTMDLTLPLYDPPATCLKLPYLNQFSDSLTDFTSVYRFADIHNIPMIQNNLLVPDIYPLVTGFTIQYLIDMGGTLNIHLQLNLTRKTDQLTVVHICLMNHRIPHPNHLNVCPDGILLQVNSSSEEKSSAKIYIPYPEYGNWYMAMRSTCYSQFNVQTQCKLFPSLVISVSQARCLDGSCGRYGTCQMYISGLFVFSSCDCHAGWRGYTCSDGSRANTDQEELTAVMLLTISNVFFLPAIILAFYRRFFLEGTVYVYNFFFSVMYHACDASFVYQFCMMPFNVLSFSDFLGSYMSFWVTMLIMAKLSNQVRTWFDLVGALFIAIGTFYDKHNLLVLLAPGIVGLVILTVTWVYEMVKTRHCYPSRWWYIKGFIPGLVLATIGTVIFSFLETMENYKYTHSVWHVLISSSIVFFLPRCNKKEISQEDAVLLAENSLIESDINEIT